MILHRRSSSLASTQTVVGGKNNEAVNNNNIDNDDNDSLSTDEEEDESLAKDNNTLLLPEVKNKKEPMDVNKYMAAREMTATQERWNALTMLPNLVYCLYYILSEVWIPKTTSTEEMIPYNTTTTTTILMNNNNESCFLEEKTTAPLAVWAVVMGICVQVPFSFLYHWKYAHALGLSRTNHWSRRMDHVSIHTACIFFSYATSGSWDYLFVNILFNLDCIYRQFQHKVIPRRNQIRVGLSIIAYLVPLLTRGEIALFVQCWIVLHCSGWFFIKYPVGGWSHSVFHIILTLLPPLLLQAASTLPSSHEYIRQLQQQQGCSSTILQ
mmetsp:Transcript_7833/g.8668  ORF Transcript_7833/g.8668 Transcript_7833/m.8668 type:complete len:324 (+) Transcript_7833:156-1127(+)